MKHFKPIKNGIDARPLLEALQDHPSIWTKHTARQEHPGGAHADTECIFLRGPEEMTTECVQQTLSAIDYEDNIKILQPALQEVLGKVLRDSGLRWLARVLIVKLKAGGIVGIHPDQGLYADTFERFHYVLQADPGNIFIIENEKLYMRPGEVWQINHRALHAVHNGSARERIHIIFDGAY